MRIPATSRNNFTRAKRINIISAHGLLPCVVVALILSDSPAECRRQHVPSSQLWKETIHFPAESTYDHDRFKIIDATVIKAAFEDAAGLWSDSSRSKRATDNDPVDPNNRTTVAHLNDTHTTLLVHWAGEGSDVIIALAKSNDQASSSLYLSKNYGKTFEDVSFQLMVDWGKKAVISNYYSTRSSNSHYVFVDETNRCIFTTYNSGDNFRRHCDLQFVPRLLKINSVNPRRILAMDDQNALKQLYLTEDFGNTWIAVYSRVKSFYWGIPPYDNDSAIYVVEEIPPVSTGGTQKMQVVMSESLFHTNYDTVTLISDVVDFQIQNDYMYATKAVNLLGSSFNPHLQLYVSYMRNDFVYAEFPGNHRFTDFYVADASEGQMMVCAYINNSYSNLYVSDVTGYRFSLSLERVVYFNPKAINNENWMRLYANETFADITKIDGVGGIYIASQQTSGIFDIEKQQSLITYDKGGNWELIKAPEYVIGNRRSNCKLTVVKQVFNACFAWATSMENVLCPEAQTPSRPYCFTPKKGLCRYVWSRVGQANNCSLHLTQEFHRLYPGSQSYPILAQPSSPGLVIASGVMGATLKGDPDIFMSTNAGITWRQVLSGHYIYTSGDHGGIIVAARQFRPTDKVVFSVDEGATWKSYKFSSEPIMVYGLLTEPGENSTTFSVFGSSLPAHRWQVIQINFKDVFGDKKCEPSDYKMWSVSEDLSNDYCLLGHVTTFQRRLASSICYNGDDFVRQNEVSNCTCKRQDFECDFGFVNRNGSCQQDLDGGNGQNIPNDCPPGSFYSHSRGYRKVSGDTCVGGDEHRYGPLQYSCPIQERTEFLLLILEEQMSMIDLANGAKVVLVHEFLPHVSAVFDYLMNCVIYVESAGNIKRTCLSQNASAVAHEIIYMRSAGAEITSMAFDWTGRNIYYTDNNNTIRVVNVDGRFERTIYTADNGVYNPQAIIVDPHHGYLFFVGGNSTTQNSSIYRASMDSSNVKVDVVTSINVTNSTSLTIDLETETLYWITAGSGYKSDIFGSSPVLLFREPNNFHHASSIGIYKNDLYISTNTGFGILMANKHNPVAWRYFAFTTPVYSMVVVSNTSQHAFSACSPYNTQCSQLCLPHPSPSGHNRSCLCGDGYKRNQIHSPLLDETCLCEPGEIMSANNTCILAPNSSTCAPDKLTCRNGHCVHSSWKCDGDNDCGDGSDEMDCEYTKCGSSSFTCRSGNCIPRQWMCDQQDDCKDGLQSDELHCANQTCSHDQFKCDNGFCISKNWLCDMDNDCHDNSDERNCDHHNTSCPPWYFTCDSGDCIDAMFKCDGHNDCNDGSDERHCTSQNCSLDFQFYCGPGQQCTFSFWRCDGEADCANGTDELNCNLSSTVAPMTTVRPSVCPPFSFTCRNGYCLGMENVCDGVNDCGDYSDETFCSGRTTTPPPTAQSCHSGQFYCHFDQYCVPMSERCNGHEECPDGTDEEDCETSCSSDEYLCAQSGRCIPRIWVCDHAPDCPLHDDETICNNHTQTCPSTQFRCPTDGVCLSMDKLCNQELDCEDGYDEYECDYTGVVNCSRFNSAREVCCTTPECGLFTASLGWPPGDGQCQSIQHPQRINSTNDCEGAIHEYSCRADQFKCGDPAETCLSFVQVCDRRHDCSNGQDEQGCGVCRNVNRGDSFVYSVTNTSVQGRVSFDFTNLSYAEIRPGLSFARLNWQNKTHNRTSETVVSVDKLKPYTTYFFAFLRTYLGASCVVSNYTITTFQGSPSAPVNLTAKASVVFNPQTYYVQLTWRQPLLPNGKIISYTIYYQAVDASDKGVSGVFRHIIPADQMEPFTARVTDGILPNATYMLWVAAETIVGKSPSSDKVKVHVERMSDLNLTVTNITQTSLKLQWMKAANAVGYRINVRLPNPTSFYAPPTNELLLLASSSQTSIVVYGLCPGTKVHVGLQVMYSGNVTGPEMCPFNTTWDSGEIILKGIQPVVNFTNGDQVETSRIFLTYNTTAGGPVKQFYIYHAHEMMSTPVVNVTNSLSYELTNQLPCHIYTVWIRPAFPTCPFTDRKVFYTKEDVKAPPMNVIANVSLTKQHFSLNLTWQSSCSGSPNQQEKYIVHMTVDNKEKQTFNSSKRELVLPYVRDGANYTFTVQTDYAGSRESLACSTFISHLGKPFNIFAAFNNGSNVTILWDFPPAADEANNFTHFVVDLKGEHVEVTNHTQKSLISLVLPKDGVYFVTITAESGSGHVIGEPGSYEFNYDLHNSPNAVPSTADVSISKTNLVAILVPTGLIIVLLSAGLVVFIVKHRRLQRSFLSFANSHYNIQSGTTTFSDDVILDGDEPLIQGFSDDEPLIIA